MLQFSKKKYQDAQKKAFFQSQNLAQKSRETEQPEETEQEQESAGSQSRDLSVSIENSAEFGQNTSETTPSSSNTETFDQVVPTKVKSRLIFADEFCIKNALKDWVITKSSPHILIIIHFSFHVPNAVREI